MPIPDVSLPLFDSMTFRLDPSTCTPPVLKRTSLPRTRPSLASSRVMPLSDMSWATLPISSLRSDSETRMPWSPLAVTVLPSTRLPCEPVPVSIPPSLLCVEVLAMNGFP